MRGFLGVAFATSRAGRRIDMSRPLPRMVIVATVRDASAWHPPPSKRTRSQNKGAPQPTGAPSLRARPSRAGYAACFASMAGRCGRGLAIGISFGFFASGISRTRSRCSRPFSRFGAQSPGRRRRAGSGARRLRAAMPWCSTSALRSSTASSRRGPRGCFPSPRSRGPDR